MPQNTVVERIEGRCGELVLRSDGEHYEVIANGVFLMDTRSGASERLLVRAAADRMSGGPGHMLIGGLGVGFSLAAALELPRVGRVTVVEREPAVIEWARGPLAAFNHHAMADDRVRCVEADLVEYLRTTAVGERFDAICLDIDNGPHWTVTEGNRELYSEGGMGMVASRLTEAGVLAVWSAAPVAGFAERLSSRFDDVEMLTVAAPRGEPDAVYVARQQYARTV